MIDVNEVKGIVDDVPVELVRTIDEGQPRWRASVWVSGTSRYTAVVNTRPQAEEAVKTLAAKADELLAAKQLVNDLEHGIVLLCNEISNLAKAERQEVANAR